MGKAKLFLTIFALLATLAVVFLSLNIWTKSDRLGDAEQLSDTTLEYLDEIEYECDADVVEFKAVEGCVAQVMKELERVGEIELEEFEEYKDGNGYVLLTNNGRSSLNSSQFTLLLSKKRMDVGCAINGSIDPGYVCKLSFDEPCRAGDVLEARYQGERAWLKTC